MHHSSNLWLRYKMSIPNIISFNHVLTCYHCSQHHKFLSKSHCTLEGKISFQGHHLYLNWCLYSWRFKVIEPQLPLNLQCEWIFLVGRHRYCILTCNYNFDNFQLNMEELDIVRYDNSRGYILAFGYSK